MPSPSPTRPMNRTDSGLDPSIFDHKLSPLDTSPTIRNKSALSRQTPEQMWNSPSPSPTLPPPASEQKNHPPSSPPKSSKHPTHTPKQRTRTHSNRKPQEPNPTNSTSSNAPSTSTPSPRPARSKPSSRRPSYTFVDPRLPTRHYRINSSATVSRNGDVDDVLALHFRSCALFADSSREREREGRGEKAIVGVRECVDVGGDSRRGKEKEDEYEGEGEQVYLTKRETRKDEYPEMETASGGFRCAMRRATPRFMRRLPCGSSLCGDDEWDRGSVRRYRVRIPAEKDKEDGVQGEVEEEDEEQRATGRRGDTTLRKGGARVRGAGEKIMLVQKTPRELGRRRKRWGCFR
ncbi:hypothetical protein M011DRAFT_462264 [Sporormia fimetaria CBS 119925]|uniref:Uncharacterized protein n=1 Tax=Sporormia fimetaria CBS 119925 TaxID=1340428 RepID=A0A6A6UY85_9PLEO|nr:hypothetical protein M011DRAFT_462264 [Sporormia fimetaria CBS 119925]